MMGMIKFLLLTGILCIPAIFPAFLEGQNTVVITKQENGSRLKMHVGEFFEVRLQQAGATGYSWQVMDLDESRLQCIESESTPTKEGRGITGAPVLRTWRFKAVGKGQTELKMLNFRSWEGADKAVDTFRLQIKID